MPEQHHADEKSNPASTSASSASENNLSTIADDSPGAKLAPTLTNKDLHDAAPSEGSGVSGAPETNMPAEKKKQKPGKADR